MRIPPRLKLPLVIIILIGVVVTYLVVTRLA
jgi:hypothetical protein